MFWISCGVKWRPFFADKRGFLGAEQSMNLIGFAFLGVVGGIFSSFSCDRGRFQVLIEGDNEDVFIASDSVPVIEISGA